MGNKISIQKYIPEISSFSTDSIDIENIAQKRFHRITCSSYILNHLWGEIIHFAEEKKEFANSVTYLQNK